MNVTKQPCPTCLQFQDFLPSTTVGKLYLNTAQSITVTCPDGSTPTVQIPAGVIGFVLNFSIGTPPYPDLVLNCVGGQIIIPVPDDSVQAQVDVLITQMLNQCAAQIALQNRCVPGEFVNEIQQMGCPAGTGTFVTINGAVPPGIGFSDDDHFLTIAAGTITSTVSVADANSKAKQLLAELFATGNVICTTPPVVPPILEVFNGATQLSSGDTITTSN